MRSNQRQRTPAARSTLDPEPRIVAVPFLERSRGRALSLLTADETAELSALSEPVRFGKGDGIYRAHAPVDNVYNLVQGAAKTFQMLPGGAAHVTRFLFPGDLFGLAAQGHYVETAEAIVPSLTYRIPLAAFAGLLESRGALALRMCWRLAHTLREAQAQGLILARNDAVGRIAMFVDMLGRADLMQGPGGTSYLPMSRSDIAEFVGLTIEAVSRAFAMLERLKILSFVDRHHFHLLDRERLEALCKGAVAGDLAPRRGMAGEGKRRAKQ